MTPLAKTRQEKIAWQIAKRWGRVAGAFPANEEFFADLNFTQFARHAEAFDDALKALGWYVPPGRERAWFDCAVDAWIRGDVIAPWMCRQMVDGDL